jgi:co-chaperonin GroES (HSP10)
MNIVPVKSNGIAFEFIDRVNSKGEFEKESTASGIVLKASFDDSAKEPRWVKVIAVGPSCTIKVGQQVLLPNLRWTSGLKFEGVRVWMSDESQAVAVRDTPFAPIEPLTNVVLFKQNPKADLKSTSGIIVVIGGSDETPTGVVLHLGPKVSPELVVGTTIYYNDTNFTDTFRHAGVTMSFIKDDSILAYA